MHQEDTHIKINTIHNRIWKHLKQNLAELKAREFNNNI